MSLPAKQFCGFLGETELSMDTSSLLFELLASASGRSNQNQPYVAVFRILLQEFLKVRLHINCSLKIVIIDSSV